jgi:hypothetical protein
MKKKREKKKGRAHLVHTQQQLNNKSAAASPAHANSAGKKGEKHART